MLGKMAELIETVISWGLRTLLGVAAGLQVVRGLVAPVMDSLKRSAVGKTAGALPGIGGAVNAVTELVLTTAVLVRNSLGIAFLLVILAVGAGPLVRYGLLSLTYRFLAAAAQPVSDKRLVEAFGTMAEGCALLMRILFTAEILCMLTFLILMAGGGLDENRTLSVDEKPGFFHVLTTALLHILPDKRYEQYIRLFMGLLLVLLICTPIFAVVGKSEELLSGFSNNYGREEQVRMKTEAEGIRETFLKGAYEQELKDQVQGILRKEGVFSAKTEVDMEKELQLTITLYGTVTEKQREAVKNELERICGLRKGQYQILASEDGMEGVGSFPSSGNPSSGGRTSGNPKE